MGRFLPVGVAVAALVAPLGAQVPQEWDRCRTGLIEVGTRFTWEVRIDEIQTHQDGVEALAHIETAPKARVHLVWPRTPVNRVPDQFSPGDVFAARVVYEGLDGNGLPLARVRKLFATAGHLDAKAGAR